MPDADGLVLDGRRLWAVQSFRNQISRWRLSGDLSSGTLDGVITDPRFRVPLTAVKFGNRLAVVNSHRGWTAPQPRSGVVGCTDARDRRA